MPTNLLDTDGNASMATMLMSSHHAFRRDIACFERALLAFDGSRTTALKEEWTHFRGALHGHHTVEDTGMFPGLRASKPELGTALDELEGHHKAIDPLLARGDDVFANLGTNVRDALVLVREIADLLATHLDAEERTVTPSLRDNREFPVPPSDDALAQYADGFAWSCAGLSPIVTDQIFKLLPAGLVERLPAAREAFDARCRQVWGYAHARESITSAP